MHIDTVAYHSESNKTSVQAAHYSKTHESSHRYLAYRDIISIFSRYPNTKKINALDYGTGTGWSADFLEKFGFSVTGVDVSDEMLHQAKQNYPHLSFQQIQNSLIPSEACNYDIIFSSFVLFELGSKETVINYLKEATRVLKDDGIFVAVTGSSNLHSPDKKWVSFITNFPENDSRKSGNLVKLHHVESDMEFTDYYWTEDDYRHFFAEAGFHLKEIIYPLGKENEPYSWKDEKNCSPFVIFVAEK